MTRSFSDWLPDRPPTWWEISTTFLFGITMGASLFPSDSISWGWVVVGFILTGIAVGPAGATTAGKRFGQWFREIGGAGRIAVIVLLAIVIWGTIFTVDVPIEVFDSLFGGMWIALILYVLGHVAKAREISGRRTG